MSGPLLGPLTMLSSTPPGLSAAARFSDDIDQLPQATVAAVGLFAGALVGCHGIAIVRPTFVLLGGAWCGLQAYEGLQALGRPDWALPAAVLVGLPALRLWSLAYAGFLFLFGCALGGGTVLALGMLADRNEASATSLLGATVLASLLLGLSFMRFHDVCWRLVTPVAGGMLTAASLRYWVATLVTSSPYWTQFVRDLVGGNQTALTLPGAVFWTAWSVAAILGWYLQLAPFAGVREELRLLPVPASKFLSRNLPWLVGEDPESSGSMKVSVRDLPELPSLDASAGKPLLAQDAQDTDEGTQDPRRVPALDSALALLHSGEDHRPEVALILAVSSVLVLNWLLLSQSALFLGHAVLMSIAFLPLATAGMVSYSSKSLLLPRLFGPYTGQRLSRHFTHSSFNALVFICAIGGYTCIFMNHKQAGASQFGMDRGNSMSRIIHVVCGYIVMALLFVQAGSGVLKLNTWVYQGTKRLAFHHKTGRLLYCLAAINQLIAYSFPGILPSWASPVMSAMLIMTVGSTLFFLSENHRIKMAAMRIEDERRRLDEEHRQDIERIVETKPQLSSRASQDGDSEAVRLVPGDSGRFLLHSVFAEWHRSVQRRRLEDVEVALEGQDRLVQFLSQELVGAPGPDASAMA